MEQALMLDILAQARRMGTLLHEVMDTSRQLAQAVDRDDQVVIRMLVGMREEQIQRLIAANRVIQTLQESPSAQEERVHLNMLLRGEGAQDTAEGRLTEQAAANHRILKQVLELDRALNLKMTRAESVYR